MKVVSSFKYKARKVNVKPLPDKSLKDDFNPMNIDDPSIVSIGLNYLNKVKQDLKKGIINGKVIGKVYVEK